MQNYIIKDEYVKVKNENGNYFGVHRITNKLLYDPYTGYISKNLSTFTKKRIIKDVDIAIKYHKELLNE